MTVTALGLPSMRRDGANRPPACRRPARWSTPSAGWPPTCRVSLTDRCNLRCTYCMPAEGLDWLPGDELLSRDELTRLLDLAVTRLGITNVRFTGGEPLLYKGLEDVVAATAALRPRPEIALTTNGVGLARRADAPGRGRARSGQRLAGHPGPAALQRHHPPRSPLRRARRPGRRGGRGAGPGESQRRPRLRLRPATTPWNCCATACGSAISCGSSSRCRWTPVTCGGATPTLSADEIFAALAAHFRLTADPAPRGSAPARAVAGRRRSRHRRHHRLGVARVLLGLRPHPADRRRPGPQLLVRHRGDRSASAAAQRRRRRRARGGLARGDVAQGARSRHQRPRLRAAATPDERDRRLT